MRRSPLIPPICAVPLACTFDEFEPIIVEVRDGNGEGHISPGLQQRDSRGRLGASVRSTPGSLGMGQRGRCRAMVAVRWEDSHVAATALLTAIEMLEGHPRPMSLPTPGYRCSPRSTAPAPRTSRPNQRLDDGFRTFKIGVGKDADADLVRVQTIQRAIAGRRHHAADVTRADRRPDERRFAAALDPTA